MDFEALKIKGALAFGK